MEQFVGFVSGNAKLQKRKALPSEASLSTEDIKLESRNHRMELFVQALKTFDYTSHVTHITHKSHISQNVNKLE